MPDLVDHQLVGLDGFLAGLRRCGLEPHVENGVVSFPVEPVAGARAGQLVDIGTGLDELGSWPAVPPHWVHLPGDVGFARTNAQPSSRPGWLKHSRQINRWGNGEATHAWIAHLRAVAGEAAS